ncbi:hypothetical protein Ancab_026292 [Ancistrocladus abbreviatus]
MMGYSDPDLGCRKHPNQKQLPGVCSSCLREKLSKLTDYNHQNNKKFSSMVSHSSSLSSSTSPLPAYSSASPTKNSHRHRRNGSEAFAVPLGFVLHTGCSSSSSNVANGLKKSLSVSCAPRVMSQGNLNKEEWIEGNSKKKTGFWKKLIHSTSKKTKGVLMHSKTVRA